MKVTLLVIVVLFTELLLQVASGTTKEKTYAKKKDKRTEYLNGAKKPRVGHCTWTECSVTCGEGTRTCHLGNGKFWHMPCGVNRCASQAEKDEMKFCGPIDILFILDSSSSIGSQNWWKIKQFLLDMSATLPENNKYPVKASIISYSDTHIRHFGQEVFRDYHSVQQEIWDLPWLKGFTNTAESLKEGADTLMAEAKAELKIAIIFTDGESNRNVDKLRAFARELKNKAVTVFVVSVRNRIAQEYRLMASRPVRLFVMPLEDPLSVNLIPYDFSLFSCAYGLGPMD